MTSAHDHDVHAGQLRAAIRSRHEVLAQPDADGDIPDGPWRELMRLTGELLRAEDAARQERRRAARLRTALVVWTVVVVIVVASAAVAVAGLLAGALSFWRWIGVGLAIALAGVLAVPRRDAAADTDRARRLDAALCAVGGAGLLLVASGLLAWWGALIAVLFAAGAAVRCFVTVDARSRRP